MKKLKEYLLITIGFLIVALAIRFFLEPNKIAGGGVMGIAIILNDLIPSVSVGLLMLIMNVFLFVLALIVIGSKFGGKTIYSALGLSGSLWLMDKYIVAGPITSNILLATIFGTFMSGIGMGIVFNQNASTGGTDIIAKILNKFVHIDIGKALLLVDFSITLFAGATLGADLGMFSLLSVIINGFIIDTVIDGLNVCKEVMIISSKNEMITDYIINKLGRGCTILAGKGGFTGKDTYILYSVLSRGEFVRLRDYIKQVDKNAFITVNEVREVLGEGFKNIVEED
ncbi:MAG: YitT family protein [Bacillota bacterium]|nr:YitT family protein [Bacillota bacterium]